MENKYQCGDRAYGFGIIPPFDAVRVEVSVAKVIGEPLFKAFTEKVNGEATKDAEQAGAAAIGLLLSKMNADELIETMTTV